MTPIRCLILGLAVGIFGLSVSAVLVELFFK